MSQRLDKDVRGKWLKQECDAADFQGPPSDRVISIRSHEYDWDGEASVCKLLRQLKTATLPKLNIDNEADRFCRHRKIKELLCRSVEFCVVSERQQPAAHGAEDTEVIVDYRYNITLRWHE
jgi:hypothetical protein